MGIGGMSGGANGAGPGGGGAETWGGEMADPSG